MAVTYQQSQPGWLPGGVSAPAVAQAARVGDAQAAHYGEWFAWAMKHVRDPRLAHMAASAATVAELDGASRDAAAQAAQQAAAQPAVDPSGLPVDRSVIGYAPWYAWSRNDLGLDPARAATAAAAGAAASARGMHYEVAANMARQAAGLAPVPVKMPMTSVSTGGGLFGWIADPAARSLAWGVLCIVAPFAFHIIFPIAPVFGLIYGGRALMRSRTLIGIAGIAINGVALLLTLFLMFAPA